MPLPERENLDDYLDMVLPYVRPWSEDLSEQKFYVSNGGKPWLEFRDDPGFQEIVVHFFNENGEYLQAVDGNVTRGKWRLLDGTNKLILEQGGGNNSRSELFELAFLSPSFFILMKHGGKNKKNKRKYFVMGYEAQMKRLEWRDYVELLFNTYRSQNKSFRTLIIMLVILAAVIIAFSVF